MKLTLDHITKQSRTKSSLDDVSAELTTGIWALLGENGAGKTTLMHIVTGLLQPTAGSVLWDGKPIDALGADYRAVLGFLPQEPGVYPGFTGEDILRYFAEVKGIRHAGPQITELLETVNLTADKKRKVGQYSGGMKRRLGVAAALAEAIVCLLPHEYDAPYSREVYAKYTMQYAGAYTAETGAALRRRTRGLECLSGTLLYRESREKHTRLPFAEMRTVGADTGLLPRGFRRHRLSAPPLTRAV